MTLLQAMKDQIDQFAPAGFYVALRVGFSFPEEELNNLPDLWVEFYTTHGLVVQDPAMRWVYGNTGSARFSEMEMPDPQQVRGHAAVFGLSYGTAVSVMVAADRGRRSYGLFYRDDREFEDREIAELNKIMVQLHKGHEDEKGLTAAEIEALKMQSEGLRLKQIAGKLGISESAVKARLNNVKRKLGAKTQSQAASIAAARRIL
jgi:LuxR family transcriptional regulator, quorum-sensing system regulator SdiA